MTVNFYETAEDSLLKFAVIISKSMGKWTYPQIQPLLVQEFLKRYVF